VHDVFVLQVAGEKRWLVHEPVLRHPTRDQPWTDRRAAVEAAAQQEPLLDVVLRPGDALYLPAGYLHAAQALGETSAHLTVGVHPGTRGHLLAEILAQLATVESLREPLPLGIDVASSETAECSQPRGRYNASPAVSVVSITGASWTRSAIASRWSVHGWLGSGSGCTGSWTIQRLAPLTCRTKTSCTS